MNHSFELIQHKTYDILKIAKFALVTSGTATLETALLESATSGLLYCESHFICYCQKTRESEVHFTG